MIARGEADTTGLDELDPATTQARDATHLRRIAAVSEALDDGDESLQRAVADARAAGESCNLIRAALGATSVTERTNREVDEK